MNYNLLSKIKENKKEYEFLKTHSYWYKYLNRSEIYYDEFIKEFKKNKREETIQKVNSTVENIELLSNIIKFVD